MDLFETRLGATAERLGWNPRVVREILRRKSQLQTAPEVTAREIATVCELPESDQFELRVLALRKAPPAGMAGTQFVRDPPRADEPTERAVSKPPPIPPSIRSANAHKTFPPTPVATPGEAERAISGQTFKEAIRLAHTEPSEEALRSLIQRLAAAASFVGNAHRQGFVVRNLAPDNLVFGELGEVVFADPTRDPTPAYCSPEQARDPNGPLSPASDVFALGCLLFEALTHTSLFAQVGREATLKAVVDDLRRPMESPFALPAALLNIFEQATQGAPGSRQPNGVAVAVDLDRWLADLPEVGPSIAAFADHPAHISERREEAKLLRAKAALELAEVQPGDPVEAKQPAWTLQDQAMELDIEADKLERDYLSGLDRQLCLHPDHTELRTLLADHLLAMHRRLEAADQDATAIAERLRAVEPQRFISYLAGEGKLTLLTEPPGATVDLYRYELKDRRLWPCLVRTLGTTPLTEVRLGMGSYVAIIKHPDRADVRYPIFMRRRTHWHGRGPESTDPAPIVLPTEADLEGGAIFVPAGWFRCGGCAEANAMPRTWTWCAGFLIHRHPVSMAKYLKFLDALFVSGSALLSLCTPRTVDGTALAERRNHSHTLVEHPLAGKLDWPVAHIPWQAADAYAKWVAQTTGEPWRLPADLEWEKAARGVDGRVYPWGNCLDPIFACYGQSHAGLPHPVPPDAFPSDSSPYGVRGMAGNIREWCRDPWQSRESIAAGQAPGVIGPTGPKVVRGGHYAMTGPGLESCMRSRIDASTRAPWLGFRLVRRFPS